ncbi:MAG: DPP IV N-terminal domain-containing protein [Actinomycetota bacterium]
MSYRTKLVACAASAVLLLSGGTATADRVDGPGAPPPPAELNGRYLVSAPSNKDATTGAINWDIFSMNLDGSDRRQLTDSPASDQLAAWSPDGQKIAYMTHRTGKATLWVMNADGSNQHQVSNTHRAAMAPAWSPDGTQLAYMSTGYGNQIFVLDLATGQNRQITTGNTDQYPTWSPDGKKIAYSTYLPGSTYYDVVVINADGTNPVNITRADNNDWGFSVPRWSPDGRWIAALGRWNDIVLLDPDGDGTDMKTVVDGGEVLPGSTCAGGIAEPSWAPDSKVLMFRACNGTRIINVDGTGERNVFTAPGPGNDHVWPAWQPRSCSPTGEAAPGTKPTTKGVTQVCGAIPIPPPATTSTTTTTTAPPGGTGSDPSDEGEAPGLPAEPPVGPAAGRGPRRSGYWMVTRTGNVYAFGDARRFGDATGGSNIVDLEPTPSGEGYWIVDDRGRVLAFGDARLHGAAEPSALRPDEKVTSLSATPSGNGYWVFTSRGRAITFGDAPFLGDLSGTVLNAPVLGSIPTASGRGYWMVAADGGIFSYGDAAFAGSMGGQKLNAPVQSLVPDGEGTGYWLVAADGGIFAFDAPFRGSMGGHKLNRPVRGMVPFGDGYLMVGEDGGIFNFSAQPFSGSLGGNPPSSPVVTVAGLATGS